MKKRQAAAAGANSSAGTRPRCSSMKLASAPPVAPGVGIAVMSENVHHCRANSRSGDAVTPSPARMTAATE